MKTLARAQIGMAFMVAVALPLEAAAQNLVGRWAGNPTPDVTMIFEFKDDGTGIWNIDIPENPEYSGAYDFEYRLNPEQTPMILDLVGFDRGPTAGKGLFGIVRFEGPDVIFLDFEDGPANPEGEPVRPADFTSSTQRLERIVD